MSKPTSRPRNPDGTINWSAVQAGQTASPVPALPDELRPATQTLVLPKIESTASEAEVVARLARAYGEMTAEQIAALSWTQKIALAQGKPVADVIAGPRADERPRNRDGSVNWTAIQAASNLKPTPPKQP